MNDDTLKLVIVGHVDHGKSTLIGRLLFDTGSLSKDRIEEIEKTSKELGKEFELAFLTDHLREEREGARTIDTTQVFFSAGKRHYAIIDAPGHVEFIKNMITGTTHADVAILVVSVKEGVEEQTRRHAYLLKMLGIKNLIVAVNKMDMVDYSRSEFLAVKRKTEELLSLIGIAALDIIPISAREGDNIISDSRRMFWHRGRSLLEVLDGAGLDAFTGSGILRLPVQDMYNMGDKKLYAGRVESGELNEKQSVLVLPCNKTVTVESIHKFKKRIRRAGIGECVGFILKEPVIISRGEVICGKKDTPAITRRFKAVIFCMSNGPLKVDEELVFKCVTQEVLCRVEKIERRIDPSSLRSSGNDAKCLEYALAGEVSIKTEQPVVIDDFRRVSRLGRFILEKEHDVVAGGIVTY